MTCLISLYPSLQSHEIEPITRRYGMKVWQCYLENKKSGARNIIRDLREHDAPISEIARIYKVNRNTVSKFIKERISGEGD